MSFFGKRFKCFFSFYKPYRGLFAADVLCAAAVSAASLVLPLFIRRIIREAMRAGVGPDAAGAIFPIAAAMGALIVFQTACNLFYDHMGHVLGARMERDMRNRLFAHYQTLPFSFFDREKTGSVISRIAGDLLSLAELYHHGPEDIIIYALTFAGALVILIFINAQLALAIAAFLPVIFIFSLVYSGILNRAYGQNRKNIAEVSSRIEDSIAGIRTVKSFGNENLETEKFREANERFYESRASIYKHEARYYTGMGVLFTQFLMVIAVVFGAVKISGASLDIADFISFILYVNYLAAPVPQLARITAQYQEGISGFNRFMDIMETPGERYGECAVKETKNETDGRPVDAGAGSVEFEKVDFRYTEDGPYILKDVSFTIKSGEFAALTGPSGIGKTTLCSLVPRFYEPLSGRIMIGGIDAAGMDLHSLRRRIGIVRQDLYVFSGTIRENIAYGRPGASAEEITAAAKKADAHDFIMSLPGGYDTPTGPRGLTLSGGQRQRLCIARVFLKDPPILIFDEATSALDYESEAVIQNSLMSLSENRTVIVIAHRLSTIKNAGRLLVLDGQTIREG
ncbi:MAG: ABC transporter ATP-binding protein/permease [Treponema sp.]|nr:ABC transporter ATP-binding protein/permease [Treponema sp.]